MMVPVSGAAAQQVEPAGKPAAKDAAAKKDAAKEAPKKDPTVGPRAYEAGAKAFEAGKLGEAAQAMSTALAAGGLTSAQMAKALYYRGVAYRKEGKTAQAISDLTAAIWLKNGLSDADRAAAIDSRQGAYREAGLESPTEPAPFDPDKTVAATTTKPVAGGWETATAGSSESPAPVVSSPAPPIVAAAPADSGVPTSLSAMPPDSSPTTSSGASLGGVGSFFNNLFSGGSASSQEPAPQPVQPSAVPVTTSSTTPPAEPVEPAADWGVQTQVSPAKPAKIAANDATAATPPPVAAKPAASGGKYRLQVATARSRDEALRLAQDVKQRLGQAEPEIDEAVFGNMGTFYRVRLGPYANADVPEQLCTSLKPHGFDCFVVTQ
jgi:hypothetical protein